MRSAVRFLAMMGVGVLALGGVTAWAGGVIGSDAPGRVPVPADEFTATIHDNAGVEITINRVTFNGEVFFYGVLGEAQVTIPFSKVASVRIEPSDSQNQVVLFATLKDGQSARILVDDDQPIYGVAPFGNYSIEVQKVRSLTLRPTAQ